MCKLVARLQICFPKFKQDRILFKYLECKWHLYHGIHAPINTSVYYGDMDMLIYLHGIGARIDKYTLYYAIEGLHYRSSVIKYVYENTPQNKKESSMEFVKEWISSYVFSRCAHIFKNHT